MSSSRARAPFFAVALGLCSILGMGQAWAADELRAVESRPGSNDAPVQMGDLGAPDTSGVGLLTPLESGFPKTMWQGTSRATAAALLKDVPVASRSRALQSLAHRVLLTEAIPPEGESAGENFLALRLNRLMDIGDLESILRISDELIVSKDTSEEQKARANALLLRGADGDACLMARQMLPFGADVFWVKLDAYCKARAGDADAGELNLSLIRERGDDPVFFALYDRLVLPQGENVQPPPFDGTPLAFAFLRASKSAAIDPASVMGKPALLRAIALDAGGSSADLRLTAAAEAETYGAFPIEALRAQFSLQGFSPEASADPAQAAGSMVPARALALFFQAISQAPAPLTRVTLTSVAYRFAAQHELGPVLMDLVDPALQGIAPEASFSPFAVDLTQAYLASGNLDGAQAWFALIRDNDPPGADPARLARLRAVMNGDGSNSASAVASAATAGTPVALSSPADADLSAFNAAATQGRVAEAVLLALKAFGAQTPAQVSDHVVTPVVAGLNSLGLASDAQAILRESVLDPPMIAP